MSSLITYQMISSYLGPGNLPLSETKFTLERKTIPEIDMFIIASLLKVNQDF